MNYRFFLSCIIITLYGCSVGVVDTRYVPCQSFDEFSMREIYSDSLCEPYLYIQREKDTIKIVKTDNKNDTMIYIYKDKFWYSSVRIKYKNNLYGNLRRRFAPKVVFGRDINQYDIFRYIWNDTIIEAYCADMTESVLYGDVGKLPDCIIIHSRQNSKYYFFDSNLEGTFDMLKLRNTMFMDVYNQFEHKDTVAFANRMYSYDNSRNLFCERNICGGISDTIKLNSLALYHIPTYQFKIEDGSTEFGIYNDKRRVEISCTTMETEQFTSINSLRN